MVDDTSQRTITGVSSLNKALSAELGKAKSKQEKAKVIGKGIADKAKELIGYEPKTKFKEGLINTIEWFKENWDRIEKAAKFAPGVSSAVRDAEFLAKDRVI